MTAAPDVWELVYQQRLEFAAALADIDEALWNHSTLCSGWQVRHVVAHVVGNAEGAFTPSRALPGLVRYRFNVDRFLEQDALRRGDASPAILLGRLRAAAGNRFLPPGRKPADVLADAIIHTQDALRPLRISQHASPQALRLALQRSVPQGPPLRTRERAEGLRLQALDVDWEWGQGEHVSGPAESLLLAVTGRADALGELSGPGLTLLAQRCTVPVVGLSSRATLSST